jgi:competence protein ComEC
MAVLGTLLTTWQGQLRLDQRWPSARHGEEIWVRGQVASLPELSADADSGKTWRFLFEPYELADAPRMRVSWYRTDEMPRGGDCWNLKLRVRMPHGSLNPGGFDYEGWLFRQGIAATATVREAERCASDTAPGLVSLRQALADRISAWLPEHPARGFLLALTIGDRSGLSDHDWEVFRITGTSHLVAISGFNIAIIAGVTFFLIRWLWSISASLCLRLPAQRAALIASALVAGMFAAIAGFEPPVARAWWMLLLVLLAVLLYRPVPASRALALAWLVILLADPFAALSPGLWLSFGAVAIIAYVSVGRLQTPGVILSLVALQLVISLSLMPLTLYFFQGATWLGPLVNLLAVPIAALLTPLLLAALALATLVPGLGLPALLFCADVLLKLRAGLEWMASNVAQAWIPGSPPAAALLLALLGALLVFVPRGLPLRGLGLLCFVPLLLPPDPAPESGFELTALDVGQGLSVVVRTSKHTLLFDAGPAFDEGFDAGESVVVPFLLQQGIRNLDLLMLSHTDNDHAGGVPAVRRLLHVRREIGTGQGEPCRDGMAWEWDGVRFEALHPDAGTWSDNNSSCVLRIAGGFTALLPGDIEAAAEQRLLAEHGDLLKSDVLLAPHHGSKTSSSEAFVMTVKPEWVIFAAGWRNHFRHPRPEVVARYEAAGAAQIVTGNSGAVKLSMNREPGSQLVAGFWRKQARKFWNAAEEEGL